MRKASTILALSFALALAGCGDSGDSDDTTSDASTFQAEGFPFTFEYPADWSETGDVHISTQLGSSGAIKNVAVAKDDDNGIFVEDYDTGGPLTAARAKVQLERLVEPLDANAEGQTGTIGGFPSVTLDAIPLKAPPEGESRLIALFQGNHEYLLNCQSTPESRDEVNAACDQAVATLKGA